MISVAIYFAIFLVENPNQSATSLALHPGAFLGYPLNGSWMSLSNISIGALNIIYTGSWAPTRSGSMMSTSEVLATALIPFYGTQILAHGFQTPKASKGFSCSVDGHPLIDEYDTYLCNITVPLGQHNLTITNLAMNTVLSIDYFLIPQPVTNTSTYIQSTTTTALSPKRTYNQPFRSNPNATIPSITTPSLSSSTISSAVVAGPTTPSSRNHATLIGGTVGGLALLVVVVGIMAVWFVKKRRKANRLKAPSAMFVNSSKSLDLIPHTGKSHHIMYQM